ncbi:MAG: hypothetical protein WBM76_12305, partial [Woeseiaceae bacterium]
MRKSLGLITIGALSGAALLFVIQKIPADPDSAIGRSITVDTIPTLSGADLDIARESSFIDMNG